MVAVSRCAPFTTRSDATETTEETSLLAPVFLPITNAPMKSASNLLLAATLALASSSIAENGARIYPAPTGETLAANFSVTVDGKIAPVYLAKVAPLEPVRRFKAMDDKKEFATHYELAAFASFDLQGSAEISVTCAEPVREAKILPSSYGITPVVRGNRVSFTLAQPRHLTLEINGDSIKSLHVFANPLETDTPRPDDPNVIYFGPGIHEADHIIVPSGKTVYIAGGAIVRGAPKKPGGGSIFLLQGDHITLRGRGIIDGSLCPLHTRHLLAVRGTNIVVEGVILRDSSTWTVPIRRSENVAINNLKLLGCRPNSDGIDVCNSRNVDISDCFIRTLDDLIVVKSDKGQGEVSNVTAHDCVLWNEVAHALSVGAELREKIDGVRFSNCDVIHDKGREWTLRVYHCDSALIRNVRFENIRVEETKKFISLWIGSAIWSRDTERGHIENITFQNIQATGDKPRVEFKAFDAAHEIRNVTCDRVTINGQPLKLDDIKRNTGVENITVTP
jgi:hypothetical protein